MNPPLTGRAQSRHPTRRFLPRIRLEKRDDGSRREREEREAAEAAMSPFHSRKFCSGLIKRVVITLPENRHKIGHPKRKLVFQPSSFSGYLSFREGIKKMALGGGLGPSQFWDKPFGIGGIWDYQSWRCDQEGICFIVIDAPSWDCSSQS